MPSKATVDLSEFLNLSRPRSSCVVAAALAGLADEERAQLVAALAEPAITHTAISKWLKAREQKSSEQTIRRHRNRECCCER